MNNDEVHCSPELAYKNLDFLESRDGRAIRIMAEFLQPLAQFRKERIHDTVVFFGSARIQEDGPMGHYYQEARKLARMMSEWSEGLKHSNRRFVICTGGGPGIMEAANKGAYLAGGKSIGLNISLPHEQEPNPYISEELGFEFHYFFMRKYWLVYLAKALVIFPGGFGTLDELMEVLTLIQTKKIHRPLPIVVFGQDYWREVIDFEAMARWGTIVYQDLNLFTFVNSSTEAFHYLKEYLEQWATADLENE